MNEATLAALKDLAKNIACLDEHVLRTADVVMLRETLREWRDQAQAVQDIIDEPADQLTAEDSTDNQRSE